MNKRLYNLDFIRFLCCITILITHANLIDLLPSGMLRTSIGVSFFFILSGFFLHGQCLKGISIEEFAVKRYIRLMPIIVISFIIIGILHYAGLVRQFPNFTEIISSIFLLKSISLFPSVPFAEGNSHLWYIGPLFWGSIFFYLLFKCNEIPRLKFLIALVIIYFCTWEYIDNLKVLDGLCRGISGIGLGYFCALATYHLRNNYDSNSRTKTCIVTVIELVLLFLLIDLLFVHCLPRSRKEDMYGIIIFLLLISTFTLQKGYISKALNRSWLGKVGTISYSVYVLQYIPQILFEKENLFGQANWYISYKHDYPILTFLIVAIILPIIIGLLGYIFVEKPAAKFLNNLWKGTCRNTN